MEKLSEEEMEKKFEEAQKDLKVSLQWAISKNIVGPDLKDKSMLSALLARSHYQTAGDLGPIIIGYEELANIASAAYVFGYKRCLDDAGVFSLRTADGNNKTK